MIAPKVHMIEIDRIESSESNPRMAECEREDELQALAADMKAHGQIQPIGVKEVPGSSAERFRVVFGSRRLKAARVAGMLFVSAVVLPPMADEVAIAAAENIHRRAMNPYEELLAVEMVANRRFDGLAGAELHRAIGEELGRSASWVRDRIFLGRLCPAARQMVIDGRLPIAHARELAKVADHERQERILGYGPLSIEAMRDECNRVGLPLAQVPWALDAKGVARKVPCTTCPNYSPNAEASGLFEHDGMDERIKGEHCLDQRCYAAKYQAAQKSIVSIRDGASAESAPRWLRAEVAAQAAERAQNPTAKPKAPSKDEAEALRRRQEERAAELERARKAEEAFDKAFDKAVRAQPGVGAMLFLLDMSKPGWLNTKPTRAGSKLLSSVTSGVSLEALDALAAEDVGWTPSSSLRALVRVSPGAEARVAMLQAFVNDLAGLGDHPGAPPAISTGRKGGKR